MAESAKRGWLERLGLKTDRPGPEDWVVVASERQDMESVSRYAERTVEMLAEAGIQAEAILRERPKAEPISDEELTRLAEEAGPPPPE